MLRSSFYRLLLVLALLYASLPLHLPVLVAAAPTPPPPQTLRGWLHYAEDGPGASADGIANSLLLGASAPVYARRMMNIFRVFAKNPALAGNPNMKEINALLTNGTPDLGPLLPIVAHYDADISFVAQRGPDGTYTLKNGTVYWSNSNKTQLTKPEGSDSMTDSITDSFQGSGSAPLDPASTSITMTFSFKSKVPTYHFAIQFTHPMLTNGTSDWSLGGGLAHILLESRSGTNTWRLVMPGVAIPDETDNAGPYNKGVFYTDSGQLDQKTSIITSQETWRNFFDGQSYATLKLFSNCDARIDEPFDGARWVFDGSKPGVIDEFVAAKVFPPEFADDLVWTLPDIGSSKRTTDPDDRHGALVKVRYEGLPEKNSDFGEKQIEAHFTTPAIRDLCGDPKPIKLKIFFPRDDSNNPDGTIPNWFYYWVQTAANQGYLGSIIYNPACTASDGDFQGNETLGFYDPGDAVFNICDLEKFDFKASLVFIPKEIDGIDLFAITVRHEGKHMDTFHSKWKNWVDYSRTDYYTDKDKDGVPDDQEPGEGLNPQLYDTHHVDGVLNDDEYLAYQEGAKWKQGSADSEDWAKPGHQWR